MRLILTPKISRKVSVGMVLLVWRRNGKMGKTLQLLPLYNFASPDTSPIVKQDIQKVIHLISLKKLHYFVSYEFPLFNTSENDKS
jgi:hypothetical protein